MRDKIRYADLAHFLEGLGFVSRRGHRPEHATVPGPETFLVWEHPAADTLIPLPDYQPKDAVRPHHLSAVRAILEQDGLLTRDAFERWRLDLLRPTEANGAESPQA